MPFANIIGVLVFLGIAYGFSENRAKIAKQNAIKTLALQFGIAMFCIGLPFGVRILNQATKAITGLLSYANEGMVFVFGELAKWNSVEATFGAATGQQGVGTILAFQVFPVIVFLACLFAILFHLQVMDFLIRTLGGAVRAITGASRLESTVAAASIFVGMVEAPLAILPYLKNMTRSQLFTLMSCGMASIAGTVLVVYIGLGIDGNLLIIASFMAAPGGLLMGKILVPETDTPYDIAKFKEADQANARANNLIEAATNGALAGLHIMMSVLAVIIAFVAVLALINGLFGTVGSWVDLPNLSLELIFGYVFSPIAWLIGVPMDEVLRAGPFLGQKLIANEFLAYLNFSNDMASFSPTAQTAITIALCGFCNFVGIGILMAGLGAAIPERKSEISSLGLKALLAGSLSNFLSASLVGIAVWMAGLIG